jgi:hypothetical protein
MVDEQTRYSMAEKYFDVASDIRKFEIGLFWQRSLFFWGFIGAAFVAYATLGTDNQAKLLVSCFALVCSVAWTLLNRGSKYWQEAWEQKTERKERDVFGEELFHRWERVERKFWLLRARRYSVSKLSIALSDFTAIVWFLLALRFLPYGQYIKFTDLQWQLAALAGAVGYSVYMVLACRTSRPR